MKSKVLKLLVIGGLCLFSSCHSDDDIPRGGQSPNDGIQAPFDEPSLPIEMQEVTQMENEQHHLYLETVGGKLYNGYNDIYLRIEEKESGHSALPEEIKLSPQFNESKKTENSKRSSPHSSLTKIEGQRYRGYIIFDTPSTPKQEWLLAIHYKLDGQPFTASKALKIDSTSATNHLKAQRFKGEDGSFYTLALISPEEHHNGLNEDIYAGLYREDAKGNYAPAKGYTLHVDPRMPGPGMKNHSTPFDDFEEQENGFYKAGSISYSMTGYWELNFRIQNPEGEWIAGEEIPEVPPAGEGVTQEEKEAFYNQVSSVHFRIDIFN